jgi:hypothetical protein
MRVSLEIAQAAKTQAIYSVGGGVDGDGEASISALPFPSVSTFSLSTRMLVNFQDGGIL